MADSNEFIDTFRQEADELLVTVEESILDIEDNAENTEAINALFRAVHTLKGSGAMFGYEGLAAFAHHLESVLDRVRSGELSIDSDLIDLVLASRDLFKGMLANDPAAPCDDPEGLAATIQGLRVLCAEEPEVREETALAEKSARLVRVFFQPGKDTFLSGMDPAFVLMELRDLGECHTECLTADLPPIDRLNPLESWLSWKVDLLTTADLQAVRNVFLFVEDSSVVQIEEAHSVQSDNEDCEASRLGDYLVSAGATDQASLDLALKDRKRIGEFLVDAGVVTPESVVKALAAQDAQIKKKAATENESVRVPSAKLDKLIDLVGELVINQAQLTQVAHTLENTELSTPTEEVERLVAELRDLVLSVRMMPIGSTFNRFRRLVRDLSAELGKDIELATEGGDTELDKGVLDRLADPLVHLIRNCVDHGIESPAERLAAGKPAKGQVRLSAAHRGTNVIISVQDDGMGLDTEAIRRKAIEKGLIGPDAHLSSKETCALVMKPGFSTAQKVTNLSGRGVGMDVVKREIDALRGSIEIDTTRGVGTTILLSLPLTLAIIEGLLVQVDDGRYVIPLSVIEECLELTADSFVLGRHRDVVQVRGEPLPCVFLRQFFHLDGEPPLLEECVVVRLGSNRFVIVVDHVIGDHQTVVKSLGRAYRNAVGLSGATICGDGTVALILDVDAIVRQAEREEAQELRRSA